MTTRNNAWIYRERCPSCKHDGISTVGSLPSSRYRVAHDLGRTPNISLRIFRCQECNLYFKEVIPGKTLFEKTLKTSRHPPWDESHSFKAEAKFIASFVGHSGSNDILDVGAGQGGLLRAFAGSGRRLSALDVLDFGSGGAISPDGEMVKAWLEDDFSWSGLPYDIVTCFDVLEHLHDAQRGFSRLRRLLKRGGLLIIETGNTGFLREEKEISAWWYVELFEHHIFWNRQSINFAARAHGFDLVSAQEVRHKAWANASMPRVAFQLGKRVAHRLFPRLYRSVVSRMGVPHAPKPRSPLEKDHIRVVLRKR